MDDLHLPIPTINKLDQSTENTNRHNIPGMICFETNVITTPEPGPTSTAMIGLKIFKINKNSLV